MKTQDQQYLFDHGIQGNQRDRCLYGPEERTYRRQHLRRAYRRWLAKTSRKIAAKGGIPHEQK